MAVTRTCGWWCGRATKPKPGPDFPVRLFVSPSRCGGYVRCLGAVAVLPLDGTFYHVYTIISEDTYTIL